MLGFGLMYGMVHRAICELLAERHSETEWEAAKSQLSINPDGMISAQVYPDGQTLQLVNEAAGLLGVSAQEFLQQLGHFWITFAERSSYRHILDFTGADLASFIVGLDRMHEAVASAMPEADVPSFSLVECKSGMLIVDYRSNRQGLEGLVIGLFHGLLERFRHHGEVVHVGRFDGAARFAIRYG